MRSCLQIHAGNVIATPESLLLSAAEMGVERDLAIVTLQRMADVVLDQWRERLGAHLEATVAAHLHSAFRLAEAIRQCDFAPHPDPAAQKALLNCV